MKPLTNKARRGEVLPVAELLADLYATIDRKCRRLKLTNPLGDRGTLVTRVLEEDGEVRLFVMEAGYRGTIFPRIVYLFPSSGELDHGKCLRKALRAERSQRGLVAQRDCRPSAPLVDFVPALDLLPALDHNGNGGLFSREVSIARATRQIMDAERALKSAQQWLERAEALEK